MPSRKKAKPKKKAVEALSYPPPLPPTFLMVNPYHHLLYPPPPRPSRIHSHRAPPHPNNHLAMHPFPLPLRSSPCHTSTRGKNDEAVASRASAVEVRGQQKSDLDHDDNDGAVEVASVSTICGSSGGEKFKKRRSPLASNARSKAEKKRSIKSTTAATSFAIAAGAATLASTNSNLSPAFHDQVATVTSFSSSGCGPNLTAIASTANNPLMQKSGAAMASTHSNHSTTKKKCLSCSSTASASRRKSKWSREDDAKIRSFVERHGAHQWSVLAQEMPGRNPKQIRERWSHHLRPDLTKQKPWTKEEDRFILYFLVTKGNRWMQLAGALPGRTDNSVKNRFHGTMRKIIVPHLIDTRGEDADRYKYNNYLSKAAGQRLQLQKEGFQLNESDIEQVIKALHGAGPPSKCKTPQQKVAPAQRVGKSDTETSANSTGMVAKSKAGKGHRTFSTTTTLSSPSVSQRKRYNACIENVGKENETGSGKRRDGSVLFGSTKSAAKSAARKKRKKTASLPSGAPLVAAASEAVRAAASAECHNETDAVTPPVPSPNSHPNHHSYPVYQHSGHSSFSSASSVMNLYGDSYGDDFHYAIPPGAPLVVRGADGTIDCGRAAQYDNSFPVDESVAVGNNSADYPSAKKRKKDKDGTSSQPRSPIVQGDRIFRPYGSPSCSASQIMPSLVGQALRWCV